MGRRKITGEMEQMWFGDDGAPTSISPEDRRKPSYYVWRTEYDKEADPYSPEFIEWMSEQAPHLASVLFEVDTDEAAVEDLTEEMDESGILSEDEQSAKNHFYRTIWEYLKSIFSRKSKN